MIAPRDYNPGNGRSNRNRGKLLSDFELYMKQAQHSLLSREQEIELAKKARRGSEEARNELIKHNFRLVATICWRYEHSVLDFLDVIQAGNTGLIRAAEKFDPGYRCRFSTYATWWIRQQARKEMLRQKRGGIPSYMQEIVNCIEREKRDKGSSFEEAYAAVNPGYSFETVLRAYLNSRHFRISGIKTDEGEKNYEPSVEPDERNEDFYEKVREYVDGLDERERFIVRGYYGFDGNARTLQEMGDALRLTKEAVRLIRDKALKRLREKIKNKSGVGLSEILA